MKKRKRSLGARARAALNRSAAASGTATLATLGLTTCTSDGGGVVDPPPPPPLVCKDANHGQNLYAYGSVDSLSLSVNIYDTGHSSVAIDTVFATNVTGATLDSITTYSHGDLVLSFTLDSLAVTDVTFILKGTWNLKDGPCNFQRTFTVMINNGQVDVSHRLRRLPLEAARDVRIELVERDGLRVNLRAAIEGEGIPEWRATAGKLEALGRLSVLWELPTEPGYYQIEVSVDGGTRGVGFDALALEVS